MKKVFSLLLVTLLLVASVPAFADDAVAVQPGDTKVVLGFNEKSDVTILKHKWMSTLMTEENANDVYTMGSKYSAHWYTSGRYLNYQLDLEDGVDVQGYDYINFVVYSDSDISMPGTFSFGPTGSMSYWFTAFKNQWTVQSIPLSLWITQSPPENGAYRGFSMNTETTSTIPTGMGYANEGMSTKSQEKSASANIYLDSIFVSKGLPVAPQIAETSIANGATGVSADLSEYVVTFDSKLAAKTVTAETLTVKETESGTAVAAKSVTANGDKATITFEPGALTEGTEYTVTVSGDVRNAYGVELGADASYTFTTSPYELSGIGNGETIYANRFNEAVLTKTVGLNTTDNVASVTYYVDGTQKAVVNASPFTYDVEIADVNEHAVSATVIDTVGVSHNLPAVTYSADFLASGNAVWTDDFDDEATGLHNQQPTKGTITFVDDPATTNKRSGKVAYIDYIGGHAAAQDDSCFVKSFKIPTSKQVRIDFDMFFVTPKKGTFWMNVRPATYSYSVFGAYRVSDQSNFYKVGEWNEVSILVDFLQNDKTSYKTYVNGVLSTSGTQSTDFYARGGNYVLHFMSQADYYIDNLKIYDYAASTVEAPAVGCVDFAATETGWDADVVLANLSDETSECTILTAVYDAAGNLIGTDSEVVTVGAGKIVGKEYTIAKTQNGKTGAKVRAFVWESVEGVLTLRPIAEIK